CPFDLIHHRLGRTAPVRVSIHRMTAPITTVRATPRRDHRNRAYAVMRAPGAEVWLHVDVLAVRPRLRIEIREKFRRSGFLQSAVAAEKYQSRNGGPRSFVEPRSHQAL